MKSHFVHTENRSFKGHTVVTRYNNDPSTDRPIRWQGQYAFDPDAFIAFLESKYGNVQVASFACGKIVTVPSQNRTENRTEKRAR